MQIDETTDVLTHVGENVRRMRMQVGLSQAALADRSGISRRTVIKLEAGEANISLTGLDHLADALGATFVDLVASPTALRTDISEVAWRGSNPASIAALLASVPAAKEAQLWTWALGPGDHYAAQPDPAGWSEMILVTEGTLRVEKESGAVDVTVGGHIAFPTSQQYSFVNSGDGVVRFTRVVVS